MKKTTRRKSKRIRSRLCGVLAFVMILSLCTGCGKKKEEKYVSPSFDEKNTRESSWDNSTVEADYNEASYGDAVLEEKRKAMNFRLPTPPNPDPYYAGYYSETAYANTFLNLAFDGAGSEWYFYDTAKVAQATGQTEDEVINFREGIRKPTDYDTVYFAIMYTRTTASNIIISAINPEKYVMEGLSAGNYLQNVVNKYPGRTVSAAHFLGHDSFVIDIPEEETGVGRRVQYAYEQDGLIILITLTLQKEDKLEDILARFTTLK